MRCTWGSDELLKGSGGQPQNRKIKNIRKHSKYVRLFIHTKSKSQENTTNMCAFFTYDAKIQRKQTKMHSKSNNVL